MKFFVLSFHVCRFGQKLKIYNLAEDLFGHSTFYSAPFWVMQPKNRPVRNTARMK
jgi:hypothetical protein